MSTKLIASLAVALAACAPSTAPPPSVPLTVRAPLCTGGLERSCLDFERVERWLRSPALRVVERIDAHRGIQGASVLTVAIDEEGERQVFRAKWRPSSAGSINYSESRVAIAATELQRRLVPRSRQVIPPTTGHCFPVEPYRRLVDAKAEEAPPGSGCVWGSLSFWLETAEPIDDIDDRDWYDHDTGFDRDLYARNPVYRAALGTINLVTYLSQNGDAHDDQFLVRPDPQRPHVFLVDNSMGFGSANNSRLEGTARDWTTILVALPRDALDRLFRWEEEDFWSLASLERYELVEEGLVPLAGPTPAPEASWPARQVDGFAWWDDVLHVGLSAGEIDALRERVEHLREEERAGRLPTLSPR